MGKTISGKGKSMADKMAVAERYKPSGASKGAAKPSVKVSPSGTLKKPGIKIKAKW